MSDFSSSFGQLENNIKLLVEKKVALEREFKELQKEKQKVELDLNAFRLKIEELEEKNKILRIARGAKEGNTREIKLKINEIVREVDKCIAQLNQ